MRRLLLSFLTACALAAPPGIGSAQQPTSGPSTPVPAGEPDEFGEQVRAYLLAHPEVLDADPGLRLVHKEFPILGDGSEAAARVALAAERQGKYRELHQALMSVQGSATEENALAAAAAAGLDVERLRRDMGDPAITDAIARNRALAAALGINGTPGFVVAGQVVPGAVDRATLEGLIAEARQGKAATR